MRGVGRLADGDNADIVANEALQGFQVVQRSGRRIVGFDLTEVVPAKDGSEWDENVGARILYKLIGWTLRSRA